MELFTKFGLMFLLLLPLVGIAKDKSDIKIEIDTKNHSAWNNFELDINKSYEIAYWCYTESDKIEYQYGLTRSNLTLGLVALQTGDIELALRKTLFAQNSATTDSVKSLIHNQLGRIHLQLSNYDAAKIDFMNAMKINSALNLQKNLQGNYVNYGTYMNETLQVDSAMFYFNKAYEVSQKLNDTVGIIASLNNLGYTNAILGDIEKEQFYYQKILTFAPYESVQRAKIFGNLSASYFQGNKLKKAKYYADSSLRIAENIQYIRGLKYVYNIKSKIEEKLGNYRAALLAKNKSTSFSQRLIDESTFKKITQIQLSNEFKQQLKLDSINKAKELAVLQKENERKEAVRQEQINKRNILIYCGVVFIIGIAYVAFKFFKVGIERKKANEIISKQKYEVEKQRDLAKNEHAIAEEQKKIVENKNSEILESISYAKRLQEAILPPQKLVKSWLTESFIFYKSRDIVAGDLYWMETAIKEIDGQKRTLVYFAAADCTGHGVPGALVSVVCANALNRAVKEFELRDPGKILDKVTSLVIESFEKSEEEIKDGMDLALCALDLTSQKLYYAGANNPLWLLSKSDKLTTNSEYKSLSDDTNNSFIHEIKATKQPVGQFDKSVAFFTNEVLLQKGDQVLISSDGFADQFGGTRGKKYKTLNFKKFLLSIYKNEIEKQKELLAKEILSWQGELEQVDDICVVGVLINGNNTDVLTEREVEVIQFVAQGLSSKMIADKMNISKHTVDTHRRKMLAKTGTYNAAELIKYCQEAGII